MPSQCYPVLIKLSGVNLVPQVVWISWARGQRTLRRATNFQHVQWQGAICCLSGCTPVMVFRAVIRENQQLVTNEPVEFDK